MPKRIEIDESVEVCPIELGRAARARLNALSKITGKPPLTLAAELLCDMLEEDERVHDPSAEAAKPHTQRIH